MKKKLLPLIGSGVVAILIAVDKCDKKELGKCDARTNPFDARLGRAYE